MNGMSPVGSFRFSRQSPARYSRRRSKEPFSSIPKFNGPVDTLCKVLERRACLAKRTSGHTGGWLFSIFTYVCVLDVQSRQRTGPSPVPAVRSADLKSAWEFQNKILAAHAGQQMIIDIRGVCSPGADVAAVGSGFRCCGCSRNPRIPRKSARCSFRCAGNRSDDRNGTRRSTARATIRLG